MPVETKTLSLTSDASGDASGTITGIGGVWQDVYIEPITGSPGTATWTITDTKGKDLLNGAAASGSSSARLISRADMGGTACGFSSATVTGASMGNTKTWEVHVTVVS